MYVMDPEMLVFTYLVNTIAYMKTIKCVDPTVPFRLAPKQGPRFMEFYRT